MLTMQRAVAPLGVLLALLFVVVTVGEIAVVVSLVSRVPELVTGESSLLRPGWAMGLVAVLGLACVQAVIVSTAALLRMVARDRIFSADSLPWVDRIVRAIGAGWALLVVAAVPVVAVAELDDAPGLAALHLLLLLVASAVGLLMVVMRALLRQATTLRSDLDGVI